MSLHKMLNLQLIDVMMMFVEYCHTHTVEILTQRKKLNHLFVQHGHICCSYDSCPDLAKKTLKFQIFLLLHLLIKNNDVCKSVPDKLVKSHQRFLEIEDLS